MGAISRTDGEAAGPPAKADPNGAFVVRARPPNRGGRARRIFGGILVAFGAGLAGVLLLAVVVAIRQGADGAVTAGPPVPVRVSVITLGEAAPFVLDERYAGRIEPRRESALSFERAGTLATVHVEEGAKVAAGDLLARLDTRALEAERDRLAASRAANEARRELAAITLERASELKERGHATTQRFDAARLAVAELEATTREIDAALAAVAVNLDKSRLTAPFAGHVAARRADEGAIVQPGMPVIELLEGGARRLRVGLPEDMGAALAVGDAVAVSHGGKTFAGRIAALRPDIDPATQTLLALVDVAEAGEVPFGAVARVVLKRPLGIAGFRVPVTALEESARGLWSVATVVPAEGGDGPPRAGLEAVEVIAIDGETALVRGTLASGQAVIVEGRHRVVRGTPVEPVEPPAERAPGTAAAGL